MDRGAPKARIREAKTVDRNLRIEVAMEKVPGIGGVFFHARGPKVLAGWYHQHLGIDFGPEDYHVLPWQQQAHR